MALYLVPVLEGANKGALAVMDADTGDVVGHGQLVLPDAVGPEHVRPGFSATVAFVADAPRVNAL